ncbi:MAG: histidine ammonia-lyase [Candidatus Sericytochromatia bacterium]|nr:histidine ammonia-lyase [Candidatus Sericytochromatia bacterium]
MTPALEPTDAVLALNGRDLTVWDVARVARQRARVALAPEAVARVRAAREAVERMLAEGRVVYGITTGFGFMKDRRISPEQVAQLQANLVRSHAAGVGEPLPTSMVRAMMLLRVNALARGFSGVRPEVLDLLVELLNREVHPCIPSQGSVGASGDLAPLSHLALVLMGEGLAEVRGMVLPGADALEVAGLAPLTLQAKEGLALINGTQAMGAMGCLALEATRNLAKVADVAAACTVEALLGSHAPFAAAVHALRPHRGQLASARNLSRLLAGSRLVETHRTCGQVQDGYSLRCVPQVHGATRDTLTHAREVFTTEINAVTDNPLIFAEQGEAVSAGHFHGQPLALPLDFLCIAVAELANISERRTERMVNPALSNGLPAFLVAKPGLNSGLMVAQYTAAALVSENKVLCHPSSVDSIPTSAGQEDHVSMGTAGARKLLRVIAHTTQVLAIELLCAAQALELRGSVPAGGGVEAARQAIRVVVPHLDEDRVLAGDLEALAERVEDGSLVAAVEAVVGPLE